MSMKRTLTASITAVTIAAGAALAVPAMAQEATVSDAELDAFVSAYEDVVAIEQTYAARLQTAETESEQQAIVQEAQTEMAQAVDDAPDIGLERYVEILQLAQADEELRAEVTSRLQN